MKHVSIDRRYPALMSLQNGQKNCLKINISNAYIHNFLFFLRKTSCIFVSLNRYCYEYHSRSFKCQIWNHTSVIKWHYLKAYTE